MRNDRDRSLTIRNDLDTGTRISDVYIVGNGWRLVDSSWKDAVIKPHDSMRVILRRDEIPYAFADIKVVASNGMYDSARWVSSASWTKPRFYIDIDTLRLKGSGTDHFFDQFRLLADGNLPSIITSVSISDSVHWEVTGPHAGDTLESKQLVLGETRFKGASTSGEYPVTLRITTSPCDTVLTRTVIMRVKVSEVTSKDDLEPLRAYPSPASSILHVEPGSPATIHLFDVLGNEVFHLDSAERLVDIDVRSLPEGSYILTLDRKGTKESRMISITR